MEPAHLLELPMILTVQAVGLAVRRASGASSERRAAGLGLAAQPRQVPVDPQGQGRSFRLQEVPPTHPVGPEIIHPHPSRRQRAAERAAGLLLGTKLAMEALVE